MPDGLGLDEDIHSLVWRVCTDQQYYILCQSASFSLSLPLQLYIYYIYWIVLASDMCVFVY